MDYTEKIDYSSLSCYLTCPRKFLFKYIMNLSPTVKNLNLTFGSCWHYGLEKAYKEQQLNDSILSIIDVTDIAINSFNKLWDIEGKPTWKDQDTIFPKSPGRAADVYYEYFKRFWISDLKEKKIIAVEEPFTIAIDTDLPTYIGRIDLIFSCLKNTIEIYDHKSTKAVYAITQASYEHSYQTEGYLAAGSLFYDSLPSIIYNMALFQKSKIDFHRINIRKRKASIDQFFNDLIFYMKEIIQNIQIYKEKVKENNSGTLSRTDSINCFPRRQGTACTSFMRPCSYSLLCSARNNPLAWVNKPPQGYEHKEWDPEEHEINLKKKLGEV